MLVQAQPGTTYVSHEGVEFPLDDRDRFECSPEIAYYFLTYLSGFDAAEPDPLPPHDPNPDPL